MMVWLALLINGPACAYLLWDGARRRVPSLLLWMMGTAIFGVFAVPFYWASRPLRKGETRSGGFAWNVLKGYFTLWTAGLGLVAVFVIADGTEKKALDIGIAMLVIAWVFPIYIGRYLVLVLPTRNVERGPTGPLRHDEQTGSRWE